MDDSIFNTPPEIATLLEGGDPTPGIVAVEPSGKDGMVVYRRHASGDTVRDQVPFRPWLLAVRPDPWLTLRPQPEIERLAGDHPLRYLVRFSTFHDYAEAVRRGRDSRETFFDVSSSVDQFLMETGRTLFKGLTFADLRRLQLDIETTTLDPNEDIASVILVALGVNGHDQFIIDGRHGEPTLFEELSATISRLDPDVIEGHNIFNFDIPYLQARAQRHGMSLTWGRDGSALRTSTRQRRFKVGALSLPYRPAFVSGRHVVDTYQQIQRYDVQGRMESYGLKAAVDALGLTRPNREFVPGTEIGAVWRSDPDRLIRYATDDTRDVDLLSRLALPTEFYQTRLLPRSLQATAVTGPGSKINDLLVRAYLRQGHGLPLPHRAQDYPGGHAELIATGVFSPVVKCDAESLYPSLMLSERISAATDTLGAALPMLEELTKRRLIAKARVHSETGEARAAWEGLQSSFKVLINSFYGYLGFGAGLFNDFESAGRVTIAGQRAIRATVQALKSAGATPIEVDTDGVYFVPPPNVQDRAGEETLIRQISESLPVGVRLAHDGRFQAMLSLQLKNYALLGEDGSLTMKGSALRSRRLEPVFRRFLADAALWFMLDHREAVRERYFELAGQIKQRRLDHTEFGQWVMVNKESLDSQPRLRRLIHRLPHSPRSGDRIQIYERDDGELALSSEYARDESSGYLLRRLHETSGRFRPLFESETAFAAFFPPLSARTDLAAARDQEGSTQLTLF